MNINITLNDNGVTIRKVVVMEFNEYIKMLRCVFNSISDHRIDAHIDAIKGDPNVYTTNTEDSDAIEKYISDLNVNKTVEKLLA